MFEFLPHISSDFQWGDLTEVCMTGDFLSHSLDDFASQMNVNFLGHVSTVRAFLPQLLARVKRGSGVTPTAFWTISLDCNHFVFFVVGFA